MPAEINGGPMTFKSWYRDNFWEHKKVFTSLIVIITALMCGFIGFCMGGDLGLRAELLLAWLCGILGSIFGAGLGLAMVFTGRAVSNARRKVLENFHDGTAA